MKILTKANYLELRPNRFEANSGKDIVDRSDYVTPEEQYYRLTLAGIQLRRAREDLYDFDKVLEEYKTSRTFNTFMDKLDTVEAYRSKLHQYNTASRNADFLEKLRDRYLKEVEQLETEKKIRKELNQSATAVNTVQKNADAGQ